MGGWKGGIGFSPLGHGEPAAPASVFHKLSARTGGFLTYGARPGETPLQRAELPQEVASPGPGTQQVLGSAGPLP